MNLILEDSKVRSERRHEGKLKRHTEEIHLKKINQSVEECSQAKNYKPPIPKPSKDDRAGYGIM